MKLKTLAIAAATLAVGAISSQAQAPVYSQNIVGYASVIYPAGKYVLSANPLTTGNDVLTNVLHGAPGATALYYWTGGGWATYTYTTLGGGHWKNGAATVDNTNLPPGMGFFIDAPSAFTNTFSGQIVVNSGTQATNALTTGYTPVGALVPFADVVTNTSTFNLTAAGGSQIQVWDVPSQQYLTAFVYSSLGHVWKQGSTSTNPVISVGQGFFVAPATATNWIQTSP